MAAAPKKLGILVGGGPAPGINSVISAATIRAALEGVDVIGIEEGFKWLMRGDISHARELTIEQVSRIHFRGGSTLGIARDNPTQDRKLLDATITALLRLNIDKLIVIGGDDTAYSALKLEELAGGRIRVVHVPKTIDNDLDLPLGIPTFGYQTARHVGADIVRTLMTDAHTTSRWYLVIAMGRKAGHLALGIGKAAGATLTIIPEEFAGETIRLSAVADLVVGAVIKRLAYGRPDGVAMIAEGVIERMDPGELGTLGTAERDAHGHVRLAEVNFGEVLRKQVQARLKSLGIQTTVTDKMIGYELRCADPIPFDMEYTRDLGFCAAQFILEGGTAAMVSIQEGRFVPLYFKDILDPKTGRAKVRMVDVSAEYYYIARRYMLRLSKADFEDPHELAKFAATCGLTVEEFRSQFGYLIEQDLLYRMVADRRFKVVGSESNLAHEPKRPRAVS